MLIFVTAFKIHAEHPRNGVAVLLFDRWFGGVIACAFNYEMMRVDNPPNTVMQVVI